MAVTGYERKMYANIEQAAKALEQIARSVEGLVDEIREVRESVDALDSHMHDGLAQLEEGLRDVEKAVTKFG